MPQGIVYFLKVVQVAHQHAEFGFMAVINLHCLEQAIPKQAAVRQLRQCIIKRLILQLLTDLRVLLTLAEQLLLHFFELENQIKNPQKLQDNQQAQSNQSIVITISFFFFHRRCRLLRGSFQRGNFLFY